MENLFLRIIQFREEADMKKVFYMYAPNSKANGSSTKIQGQKVSIEKEGLLSQARTPLYIGLVSVAFSFCPLLMICSIYNERLESRMEHVSKILSYVVPMLGTLAGKDGEQVAAGPFEQDKDAVAPSKTARIKVERANLRSSPSTDSPVVFGLGRGSELLVTESKDGWLKTLTPTGEVAWIMSNLVEVNER